MSMTDLNALEEMLLIEARKFPAAPALHRKKGQLNELMG